jgi:hypothetical protein
LNVKLQTLPPAYNHCEAHVSSIVNAITPNSRMTFACVHYLSARSTWVVYHAFRAEKNYIQIKIPAARAFHTIPPYRHAVPLGLKMLEG